MANVDTVIACPRCWEPTDSIIKCPLCGGLLKTINSLSLAAMHILKTKGYQPVECKTRGFGKNKQVAVVFEGMSPGPGLHNEMKCTLENGYAVCVTKEWQGSASMNCFRVVHEWATEVHHDRPVPFDRTFCTKCYEQPDESWLHGQVNCDGDERSLFGPTQHLMWRGIPEKCLYAAEQVVTMHDRMKA